MTVKYVFGLARVGVGPDAMTLELPGGATVFEVLQRLGLSSLEIHAAVNGESARDETVLRDGDKVALIPAIQGGRHPRPTGPLQNCRSGLSAPGWRGGG